MTDAPATPTLPPGIPDDWTFEREVFCPHCHYNLRMRREPRCPECGHTFRWQALLEIRCPRCGASLAAEDGACCSACGMTLRWDLLLNTASLLDVRLYEYARRPWRRALPTWWAALRPARFWRRMPIEAPPDVARLRRLRWTSLAVAVVGMALLVFADAGFLAASGRPWTTPWRATWAVSPTVNLLGRLHSLVIIAGVVLLMPLLTAIALPRFGPTLSRFRIRRDQTVRCFVYGLSGAAMLGMFLGLAALTSIVDRRFALAPGGLTRGLGYAPEFWDELLVSAFSASFWEYVWFGYGDWFNTALFAAVALAALWWWRYLWVTLRRYLRLDTKNSLALFLSTQTIAGMILLIILFRLKIGLWALGHWLLMLGL